MGQNFAFSMLKCTPAWKKYTTTSCVVGTNISYAQSTPLHYLLRRKQQIETIKGSERPETKWEFYNNKTCQLWIWLLECRWDYEYTLSNTSAVIAAIRVQWWSFDKCIDFANSALLFFIPVDNFRPIRRSRASSSSFVNHLQTALCSVLNLMTSQ